MTFLDKLPPMPPGNDTVAIVDHGTAQKLGGGDTDYVVYLGLGRPQMQETQSGELVAVYVMPAREAIKVAMGILKHVSHVIEHMEGGEGCEHET
jgi:hypothetical protein